MTHPRFQKSEHSQAWFSPGNSKTLGWLTGLWIQLQHSEALGGKWWCRDIFRVLKKKKPPLTEKINPECLNGLVCPQTGCVISPQECIIPFLSSELSQDWKSESFLPVCPRSWGGDGSYWFPFHLLWSAGLDLRWPWGGTQTLILSKVANAFSRNNCFQ